MINAGRILFDVTKASRQRHQSGVLRVSACLKRELAILLEERLVEVVWSERKERFLPLNPIPGFQIEQDDIFLTAELFCEFERPGVEGFLTSGACRTYAIFHDAIPLRHPEFTWPHSVQRHPSYMKMLSLFDGVFGVSQHSSIALEEYWQWLGYEYAPSVKSLQLGADGVFDEPSLPSDQVNQEGIRVLLLGILEVRKGHDVALDACRRLWEDGSRFQLDVVGRANPYFGKDIAKRIRKMEKEGLPVTLHGHIDDEALKELFGKVDLVLFPSRAEGCGLPVLEALWKGLPVLSSRLPPVRETARFGGCRFFNTGDSSDLVNELGQLISNPADILRLKQSINTGLLPRWKDTAKEIVDYVCPAVHYVGF